MRQVVNPWTVLVLVFSTGCSKDEKKGPEKLTKKNMIRKMKKCNSDLAASHLAGVLRFMKENAETKKLAARVDTFMKDKTLSEAFKKIAAQISRMQSKLIDSYTSEEAFQKDIKAGKLKSEKECFAKKSCRAFAVCLSGGTLKQLMAVGGVDKALLKHVKRPPIGERIRKAKTFSEALAMAKPYMKDTRNDVSTGAFLMAIWGSYNKLPFIRGLESTRKTNYSYIIVVTPNILPQIGPKSQQESE